MSMEKITKEELKNLIGGKALSDDELEKVAGGDYYYYCCGSAQADYEACRIQPGANLNTCSMLLKQMLAECKDLL